jgi:diguanylate cyclase (GGDEF)-like protein/PAS domain S-box-containing protein
MAYVIIIDDQASNRLLFSELAWSIGSEMTVAAFEEPALALAACREHCPDLIITDYKMAGMTGAEFVREVRLIDGCHEVPIMVLTVFSERAFRMEALRAGATDFLLSPVDHSEFIARARNLLKMRSQQKLIENRATLLARELEQSELHREEIIRDNGEVLAQVIDTVPAFIMAVDRESRCVFVNASQARYAGGVPGDFVGRGVLQLLGGPRGLKSQELDRQVFHTELSLKSYEEDVTGLDGVTRTFMTTKTPLRDANRRVVSVVTTSLDITSRKLAEERLTRMALHDALTDLPNRYLLHDRLQRLLLAKQEKRGFALLFLDLDRFKSVNDSFGHHVGDWLLQQVAQRLQAACREEDTVARLGGDEFAILHTAAAGVDPAALARRVIKAIAEPMPHAGIPLNVTVSIGITQFPGDGGDVETLQRNADLAMYQAKAAGKNTYRFYRPAMNEHIARTIQMEAELRGALEAGQFCLHYQPQLDLRSGLVTGFEALLRWIRPDHGLVLPGVFLPVAEETGLIADIGAWVLRTAVMQAAGWQAINGRPIRIAVNVSAVQFVRQDLAALVRSTIAAHDLAPQLLDLELTEGTLLDESPRTVETLRALSNFGMQFSIDDFGTGYASMNYIKRVPISRLKIDRSFIKDFPASRQDAAVVGSVVALGHALGVPVLAEGVETMAELEAVRAAGCDEVQGYLIGRPVEAAAVAGLILRPPMLQRRAELRAETAAD